MEVIAFLIIFPFVAALITSFMKRQGRTRDTFIYICCALIVAATIYFATNALLSGKTMTFLPETKEINTFILLAEFGLMGLVIYYGFRYKKYYVALLSVVQTGLIGWLELTGRSAEEGAHIFADRLTIIMSLIVGVVGALICIYAVGYMKDYHNHHTEYKDRRPFFFAMLFVFLGAMFGLIFSGNLTWMYFFWEITSICSFLLIGYNKSTEAMNNSFRALWMNLLGGLGFAVAIVVCSLQFHIATLQSLLGLVGNKMVIIPVILLAFAGLTKSAQLPFSSWLLGAMVAPTPTSALLHSATMVKAGVYLLLRLAPLLCGNAAGMMVASIGGFTFLATSMLAIAQSDGKKVLAYSTVSNLGLITACAGIGMYEAVWAGVLLMMFHAVSKSLMFLSVGAVENNTGSRNIEDMHGLIVKLPGLAFIMIIGIAGMFLAPFGMLISKWAALKAFVDSNNLLLVIFLIFGSATTLFYWTKWLGKLVVVAHHSERLKSNTKGSEWLSLFSQAALVVGLCVTFPIISINLVEPYLKDTFHMAMNPIISVGNTNIMLMMLCLILILPVAVRLLTFGKKNKIVMSYMSGANVGDDRKFTNSFGKEEKLYLSNWYMEDLFGEKKILKPSLILASAAIIILMIIAIGGAV
ncbi:MAG TPA: proton-conducting transporter membrane subunit [Oscillospiraceae bacterium]|nr:proton-conducting transporter membrane subunit [Oscillospiraceae bacterium]